MWNEFYLYVHSGVHLFCVLWQYRFPIVFPKLFPSLAGCWTLAFGVIDVQRTASEAFCECSPKVIFLFDLRINKFYENGPPTVRSWKFFHLNTLNLVETVSPHLYPLSNEKVCCLHCPKYPEPLWFLHPIVIPIACRFVLLVVAVSVMHSLSEAEYDSLETSF